MSAEDVNIACHALVNQGADPVLLETLLKEVQLVHVKTIRERTRETKIIAIVSAVICLLNILTFLELINYSYQQNARYHGIVEGAAPPSFGLLCITFLVDAIALGTYLMIILGI